MMTPLNYAIFLLSKQDYSGFKMKQKLRLKGFEASEIEETLKTLKDKGYLKEENYRRLFIRKWMMKGESEEKIRMRGAMEKLEFDSSEFEQVQSELGFTDDESIEKLVAKKLRSKTIPTDPQERAKLRDKVLRFLISKGHSFEAAKKAIESSISVRY